MSAGKTESRQVGGARRRILRGAYYFFLMCGLGGLGYAGYVFADARGYQARQQNAFEKSLAENVIPREAPHVLLEGGVVGEMEVPRLGMKVIVAQGDSESTLRRAVGHLRDTPLPGEAGNVVLAAHRDSFFRPLRNIRGGDLITLKTISMEYQYRVATTEIVSPDDVSPLRATSEPTLTLITCFPFYYIGAAPKRFVVRARLIGPSAGSLD